MDDSRRSPRAPLEPMSSFSTAQHELPSSPTLGHTPSTPNPPQSPRHYHSLLNQPLQSPGAQPIERLAHRLSKQTLKQSETECPPWKPQEPDSSPPLIPLGTECDGNALDGFNSPMTAMEADPSETELTTTSLFRTTVERPLAARSLKRSIDDISCDESDRIPSKPWHRSRRQPSTSLGSSTGLPSVSSNSTTVLIDAEALEVDDNICEGFDDLAWLDKACLVNEDGGSGRKKGTLQFRTSFEAARRCQMLVRNVPRVRKRRKRDDKPRSRASTIGSDHACRDAPLMART